MLIAMVAVLIPRESPAKWLDDENDLVYYGYRYYNPSTGRWLSRDPKQEDGAPHLYAFVGNHPINAIDELGLVKWDIAQQVLTSVSYGNPPIVGNTYRLTTDSETPLLSWKPNDGKSFWCHGYTFDGSVAPNGPFSPYGEDAVKILKDEWGCVACANAEGGIVAYYRNGHMQYATHSGKIAKVVTTQPGQFDEVASQVTSKDGVNAPGVTTDAFAHWLFKYGDYKCYVKKSDPRIGMYGCWGYGEHEISN
jgi:RHS repeat-associated protein